MNNILLKMENITKEFPGTKALDKVTFDAKEGEILAIMGENGAGKSTLMKVLSGSYGKGTYEGEIFINGGKMEFQSPSDSESAGIAMIYQEISVHLNLSVAENVFIGRWPLDAKKKVRWKTIFEETKAILDNVDLDIHPKTSMRALNTSQIQLITIARALSKNPRILVLDEPTSALTETESEKLFSILKKLKNKGITSILISHKMDEVLKNADRVIVMRDGKVISNYPVTEASPDVIIKDMVGRSFTSFYPSRKNMPGDIIFQANNFTVRHPFTYTRNIVEDISINVRSGEILGLAGLVGAGRSELMAAIFGKTDKVSGEIYINNKKVSIRSPKDAIANGMAFVTEDRKVDGFVGKQSITNNICLASLDKFRKWFHMQKAKEEQSSQRLFDTMDIRATSRNAILDTLSGGNQQKVVISKCLLTNPKVLILDEPTKGIDVAAKNKIYNVMVDLAQKGVAIIIISSEMPELISMSDRIVVLSNGHNAGELVDSEITQENIMKYAIAFS